ncbi:MAG: flagellar basal body rod protein FlgB [Syntrophaceae bacterium]|nr:flagellar basal body rod protein FlgB [Deltaproteobacteria bacterium]
MGSIFGKVIPEVTTHMNYRSFRQEIISSNLANVDTPGYKAKEAVFEQELDSRLGMKTTDEKHLKKTEMESRFPVTEDPFSRIGNDTNTVDIDREMMKLNQNQILFDASAQIIQSKLQELKDVIGGIR